MKFVEVLNKNNIKVTKARINIYNILFNSDRALNADEIYKRCIEEGVDLNLSTVYRTLEIYEEKNIVDKVDLGDGHYYYSIKKHSHKHVVECSLCHKEVELNCPMQQFEELIKNQTGFTLLEHELVLKGVCKECKKDE